MVETLAQQRTRNDITNAFLKLLADKSFDEITVNDICQGALIHRSTFYRYFLDKVDLADHVIQGLSEKLIGEQQTNQIVLSQITEFLSQNLTLIQHLLPGNQNKFYNEFRQILEKLFTQRAQIRAYQDDPIIKLINHSAAPKLMISFLANAFMGFLEENLPDFNQDTMSEIHEFLSDIIDKLNAI